MSFRRTKEIHLQELVSGLRAKNRLILSKCITLIESTLESDLLKSAELMDALPGNEQSIRIGITGVPGVGKSTFIEALGEHIIDSGKKVAVLSVDPSSQISKGSILGDKTRMENLSNNPSAFIRPTASGATLGGVAANTRDTILLCEAAGFEVVIVETVGVGQSEIEVKHLVDYFLLLMLAGAGDDLQGIKRGIMEISDHLVINKADGDNVKKAEKARQEYASAIHLFSANEANWEVPTQTCSSVTKKGIPEVWNKIRAYEALTRENGWLRKNRSQQNKYWLHNELNKRIVQRFTTGDIKNQLLDLEEKVVKNEISIKRAINELFSS